MVIVFFIPIGLFTAGILGMLFDKKLWNCKKLSSLLRSRSLWRWIILTLAGLALIFATTP